MAAKRKILTVDDYVDGVLTGDRPLLSRAITLVESTHPKHQKTAEEVLNRIMPHTGRAKRIGISGVPGVGKSTFIEAYGNHLVNRGERIAVLAVDPSSTRTGGSILGDKTRMHTLSTNPNAFIRPSPSAGTLGGVAAKTRESLMLCDAAGFDHVLVETVGVGQSETLVANMVDAFLVLMLPGAGDELQGIKKGILEIADLLAVNKADGENAVRARKAATEYRKALSIVAPANAGWATPVVTLSALHNEGLEELQQHIEQFLTQGKANGSFEARRQLQNRHWLWSRFEDLIKSRLQHSPELQAQVKEIEAAVTSSRASPFSAAHDLFALLQRKA